MILDFNWMNQDVLDLFSIQERFPFAMCTTQFEDEAIFQSYDAVKDAWSCEDGQAYIGPKQTR